MYSLPQEIEVWYIIPAIRKEFSRVLTQKHKLTFEKAGAILGISKAAISQYLGKKRASNIKLAVKEIMRILKLMKINGCSCGVCKKFNNGILIQCRMKPKSEI